jgi:hypothetical protein
VIGLRPASNLSPIFRFLAAKNFFVFQTDLVVPKVASALFNATFLVNSGLADVFTTIVDRWITPCMLEVLFKLTKALIVGFTFKSLVLLATARILTSKPTSALSISHTCLAIQTYHRHFFARPLLVFRLTLPLQTTARL